MAKWKNVQVGKIDLDTCGAALLLDVSREDRIEVLRGGQATEEDLANPEILCIEVGGSGRVTEGNFDHHGTGSDGLPSATLQAWRSLERWPDCGHTVIGQLPDPCDFVSFVVNCYDNTEETRTWAIALSRLVEYINLLDTVGPAGLGRRQEGMFPTLSDVFAGILLVTRDPVEQLHSGVEMLRQVVLLGIDPYGRMPVNRVILLKWATYAEAKAEHNRLGKEAVEKAQWGKTSSGLRMAVVESRFIGAIGELYGVGAKVAVVLNPNYDGVRKFTVAGNSVRVNAILPELNAREPGWGGPGNGTILGSPRGKDSILSLEEVAQIVRRTL